MPRRQADFSTSKGSAEKAVGALLSQVDAAGCNLYRGIFREKIHNLVPQVFVYVVSVRSGQLVNLFYVLQILEAGVLLGKLFFQRLDASQKLFILRGQGFLDDKQRARNYRDRCGVQVPGVAIEA